VPIGPITRAMAKLTEAWNGLVKNIWSKMELTRGA